MGADSTQMCCPNCGGTMEFDPNAGKLKCIFCGSAFSQEECAAFFHEQQAQDEAKQSGSDWGSDAQDMKAYSCKTCGAEILTDENTGASRCPYCGNTTIMEAQFTGAAKPDFLIPFAFNKQQAMEKYKEYYQKKFFLPKAFLEGNQVEEIQGVYVPFWLYDGAVTIDAEFEAADKEETPTETIRRIYRAERRGTITFENVPADASKRMPDAIMDSVEPFKFDELKEFNMMYLPGFLAEKFDVKGDDDLERAEKRVISTAKQKTQATVKHNEVHEKRGNYVVNYTKKKYAMLPIWYLTTNWNGNQFSFAMNGQTGKFTGDLPVDYTKLGIITGIGAVAAGVILYLLMKSIPAALIAALIVALIIFFAGKGSMKPVHNASQANDYMDKQVHLVYCQDHFLRTERKPKEQRPAGGPPQHPTNGPSAGPQKPPSSHR